MKLRSTYILTPHSIVDQFDELPLEVGDENTVFRISDESGELLLARESQITGDLEVETETGWSTVDRDTGERTPLPRIRIPGVAGSSLSFSVDDLVDGLSFLVGSPLKSRRKGRDKLIPETKEDADLIQKVNSDEPFTSTTLEFSHSGTVSLEVSASNVETLMEGPRIGVRLYADALRLSLPTSRLQEFWRVLESAFGQKDKALVKSLSLYKPAVRLRFDEAELDELLTLRGRASHAETKKPDLELNRVEAACQKKLPRLQYLAERVILTKRTWGAPSGGVRKSAPPVQSFIDGDGTYVIVKNWKKGLEDS